MARLILNTGTESHFIPEGTDVQARVHLDALRDVTISNIQDDQILKYDTLTGIWTNVDAGAITQLSLNALTDVTITAVGDGEFIKYDSNTNEWLNSNVIDGGTY